MRAFEILYFEQDSIILWEIQNFSKYKIGGLLDLITVFPGHESNFMQLSPADVSDFGVKYDFYSIMHYPLHAFSANGEDTIKLRKKRVQTGRVGQRIKLTSKDLLKINKMYQNCR